MRRSCSMSAAVLLVIARLSDVSADAVQLLVDDRPAHGIVAAHVDLTAVAKWCGMGPIKPETLRAGDVGNGQSVPFQFVPDADFDGRERIAGTVFLRLPKNAGGKMRLTIDPTDSAAAPDWDGTVTTGAVTVLHDRQRMSGLPSRVEFRATGKVFDDFVWNDRVYDQKSGGFYPRHDGSANVELLSAGPICTVVRVRAAYKQSGGKQPPSLPEVVYQWYYFQDLPLVLVTAKATQRDAVEWKELHFLELNFPGEDFVQWAGGEPTDRGKLTGSEKGFSFSQWGALLDGQNAIAVLRSGRALIHDGRGRYGTYLHAHGSRAWQAWNSTERRFSAWLWIGSTEKPVEAIRGILEQLPTDASVRVTAADVRQQIATARSEAAKRDDRLHVLRRVALAEKLEAGGRFAESLAVLGGKLPAGWTALVARDLQMMLEKTGDGLRLLSLHDAVADHEILSAQLLPLFTLTLRHVPSKEEVRLSADAAWGDVQISTHEKNRRLEIVWRNPKDQRLRGVQVVARAEADPDASAIRWRLGVENDNDQWSVLRVVFPQIGVAPPGRDAHLFFPRGPGEVQRGVWQRAFRFHGLYPNGWTAMQFMAAYDPTRKTGLYVATHDPMGSTKDIAVESRPHDRAVVFTYDHPVPDMGKAGNGFALNGTAVWQLLRGDWFDAATIYRDWVRKEARWYPELTAEGRSDTPLWMRRLPVWALSGGAPEGCVPAVKKFAKSLGVPAGFHWYNWHKIPFDNDYPHYFPVKDGFAEGVRELQAAGVSVMPYINGRLWDTRDKGAEDFEFTRVALPAATKDENGQHYTESYGSKEADGSRVKLGVMCPTTEVWRNRVGGIVGRLFGEYGLNGVYLDQIAAASPKLCFDSAHGHPLGGGHWWTEGYWRLLDDIRKKKPADRMLTSECNAEPYIRWFDGYLTWHWQYDGQVPAFPAVYGGAIQMFGRAYRGGDTKNLALRMKAGQQLVFGEQIGWINPGVVGEKDNFAFLRQIVRLRWQLRRYFYAGEMARPPRLIGDVPTVQADWQWSGKWPVTTAAVLTGAWRLPRDDKLVLLFVNVGDEPVSAKLDFDAATYGLAGKQLRFVKSTAEGAGESSTVPAAFQRTISFPPRSAFAWELTP